MRPARVRRTRASMLILAISAATWGLLLANAGGLAIRHCPVIAYCAAPGSGSSPASLQLLLALNPVSSLMAGWALMLVAMMLPTLIAPVHHILGRSLQSRAFRSVALFVAGYAGIWMGVGLVLIVAILSLSLLMPESCVPAVGVGLIALVWHCSPVRQRCLNRRHNHRELSAFGWAADRDALHFGVTHGLWCAGSCWALMLFPMLLPQGHNLAMLGVTFVMISTHLEHPAEPRWRLRLPGKLMRILIAQTQIRWKKAFGAR